jgi:hypothetical protein
MSPGFVTAVREGFFGGLAAWFCLDPQAEGRGQQQRPIKRREKGRLTV